jgi:glucose-1-phosphatase
MTKAIIFDAGGVVLTSIGNHQQRAIRRILGQGGKEFLQNNSRIMQQYEKGRITTEQFVHDALSRLGLTVTQKQREALQTVFYETAKQHSRIIPQVKELVVRLRKEYPIVCLSNTIEPHARYNKGHLLKIFDHLYCSCDIGMVKPHKQVFTHVLKDRNLKAPDCIFIDDQIENVRAARAVGIRGIHYQNPRQLRNELLQVLPECNQLGL